MRSEKLTAPQLGAWLLAVMAAPICRLTAGQGWLMVGLTIGLGCLLAGWLFRLGGEIPKWLVLPVCAAAAAASIWESSLIADCWQTEGTNASIAFAIILLAAACADGGAERAGRACATLFWLLALLFVGIIGAGFKGIKAEWLAPEPEMPGIALLVVAVIPGLFAFLPHKKGRVRPWLIGVAVLGALVSVVTVGTLSPQVAGATWFPFYRYSKGLTLFGTAKRLEALAATGITLSWFCALSLCYAVIREQLARLSPKTARPGMWLAAALCAGAQFVQIPETGKIAAVAITICCVFLLPKTLDADKTKNSKKKKKSA